MAARLTTHIDEAYLPNDLTKKIRRQTALDSPIETWAETIDWCLLLKNLLRQSILNKDWKLSLAFFNIEKEQKRRIIRVGDRFKQKTLIFIILLILKP